MPTLVLTNVGLVFCLKVKFSLNPFVNNDFFFCENMKLRCQNHQNYHKLQFEFRLHLARFTKWGLKGLRFECQKPLQFSKEEVQKKDVEEAQK